MRVSQFAVFTDYEDSTLVFHTLTREFLRITSDFDSFQNSLRTDTFPPDIEESLRKGRFLIEEDYDEYSGFLADYRQKRYGPQYLALYITPTLKCNAACEYCFQRDIRPSLPHLEGPDINKLVIFAASKLQSALGLKVTWFGGEPLLKKTYIENASNRLLELANAVGKIYSASMVTNGLLLTPETRELLLKSKIDRLQITLDGTEEIHNNVGRRDARRGFRDIIDNMLRVSEDIRIVIRVNISTANVSVIVHLVDYLAEVGLAKPNITIDFPLVYNFSIGNPVSSYGDSSYVLPNPQFGSLQLRLIAYAKKLGFNISLDDVLLPGSSQCHAVRSKGYSIWPDGSVTRCIHEVSTTEGLNISDSYLDILHAPAQVRYLNTEVFQNGLCRTCFFLPLCGGSCLHGRFFGLEPPTCCPPAMFTLRDRMKWYEAEVSGDPCPINTSRQDLINALSQLAVGTVT